MVAHLKSCENLMPGGRQDAAMTVRQVEQSAHALNVLRRQLKQKQTNLVALSLIETDFEHE